MCHHWIRILTKRHDSQKYEKIIKCLEFVYYRFFSCRFFVWKHSNEILFYNGFDDLVLCLFWYHPSRCLLYIASLKNSLSLLPWAYLLIKKKYSNNFLNIEIKHVRPKISNNNILISYHRRQSGKDSTLKCKISIMSKKK